MSKRAWWHTLLVSKGVPHTGAPPSFGHCSFVLRSHHPHHLLQHNHIHQCQKEPCPMSIPLIRLQLKSSSEHLRTILLSRMTEETGDRWWVSIVSLLFQRYDHIRSSQDSHIEIPTYSNGKCQFDKVNSAPDMRSSSSRTQILPGNHFGEETPAPSHRLWVPKSVESSSPSHSQLPSSPLWSSPQPSMSLFSHPSFLFSLNPHSFSQSLILQIWRQSQIPLCNSAPHLPSPFWAESQLEPLKCAL